MEQVVIRIMKPPVNKINKEWSPLETLVQKHCNTTFDNNYLDKLVTTSVSKIRSEDAIPN